MGLAREVRLVSLLDVVRASVGRGVKFCVVCGRRHDEREDDKPPFVFHTSYYYPSVDTLNRCDLCMTETLITAEDFLQIVQGEEEG